MARTHGAEPEKAVFTVEISALIGRCILAEIAVGTVMMKVIFQRSTSFQKLSKTPFSLRKFATAKMWLKIFFAKKRIYGSPVGPYMFPIVVV